MRLDKVGEEVQVGKSRHEDEDDQHVKALLDKDEVDYKGNGDNKDEDEVDVFRPHFFVRGSFPCSFLYAASDFSLATASRLRVQETFPDVAMTEVLGILRQFCE